MIEPIVIRTPWDGVDILEPTTPGGQEHYRRQFIAALVDMAIGATAPQAKEED